MVTALRKRDSFAWPMSQAPTFALGSGLKASEGTFVSRRNPVTIGLPGGPLKDCA